MKREIERFQAVSDDGYETTIIVRQDFIHAATRENPNAVIPGQKEARTIDGFACNRVDDNTFKIITDPQRPDLIVRRVN